MTQEKDEAGFYKAARLEDVPEEGQMLQVALKDQGKEAEIVLTKVEGQLYIFRDICPHMAFPLSIGRVKGKVLECVGHGWEFDLITGKAIYPPIRKNLVFYEHRLDGEDIWVKVEPSFFY